MLWFRSTVLFAATAVIGAAAAGSYQDSHALDRRQDGAEVTPTSSSSSLATSTATTVESSSSSVSVSAESTATETPSPTSTEDAIPSATERPEKPDGEAAPVCHAENSPMAPFCLPTDGQLVEVDETYFVSWDTDSFPVNSTVVVWLQYVNDTEGKVSFVSEPTPGSFGFVTVTMKDHWLQSSPRNNLTFYIAEHDTKTGNRSEPIKGPTVSLGRKPVEHRPPPPRTPFNKLGLAIGLPVSLLLVFAVVFGLCMGMRKKRQIGLGNVMGSHQKGFGSGQSSIKRLGRRGRRVGGPGAAIRLENLEDGERYTDDPYRQNESPTKPSWGSDTERFNEVERTQGNAFRQDVSRLKTWK